MHGEDDWCHVGRLSPCSVPEQERCPHLHQNARIVNFSLGLSVNRGTTEVGQCRVVPHLAKRGESTV
jgi:hypothetical protein